MFYVVCIVDGQAVRSPAVCWVRANELAASVGRALVIPPRIIAAENWAAERFQEIQEWSTEPLQPMVTSNSMTFTGAN